VLELDRPSLSVKLPIERRAERIADPVEKLRFLRREMASSTVKSLKEKRRFKTPQLWWLVVLAALTLATGPLPNSTAETVARERLMLVPRADGTGNIASDPRVWRVDRTALNETYSNGLRVDLTFAVSNRPRANFPVYSFHGSSQPVKLESQPDGIVYHMTESHLAPFQEDETRRLKQIGHNLLEILRRERSYHYLIDRFGRVFSVVAESDAANHAGKSIWAGPKGIYVNLNDSFLGVAFEGETESTGDVTPAQIVAARLLTEMLRSRYSIAAENCVTHAQVSVNPLNMRIGNHVDWAQNFPFAAMGLPDNYAIAPASIYAFGFEYDTLFLEATGGRWKGLDLAVAQLERQAAGEHTPVDQYRKMLQHRYKEIEAALQSQKTGDANDRQ
jgi:hypothetical protein